MRGGVASPARRLLLLWVLLLASSGGLFSQGDSTLATSTLTGVVIDEASGRTLKHAMVGIRHELTGAEGTTLSDDSGRFAFDRLPPGRYVLSAGKPPYVHPPWTIGRQPRVHVLSPGQSMTSAEVGLRRGGVVAGTVKSPTGATIPGARVTALRCESQGPCLDSPLARVQATTDNRGAYRVYGLQQGSYILAAEARLSSDSGDIELTPPEAVAWAEQRLRADPAAAFPGAVPAQPSFSSQGPLGYITTYYPGTSHAEQASRLTVALDQEYHGIDVVVQRGADARIFGVVYDDRGRQVSVRSLTLTPNQQRGTAGGVLGVQAGRDGAFSTDAVPAGRYRIHGRLPVRDGRALWASADVVVDGLDVTGVALHLRPTLSIRGRVVAASPGSPIDLSGVRVAIWRADVAIGDLALDAAAGATDAEGVFRIEGVVPGVYEMIVVPARAGLPRWPLSAITQRVDVLESRFSLSGDVTDLVVTLSDALGAVRGRLQHADGAPAFAYTMLAFPTDATLWHRNALGDLPRRIRTTPVASDGSFSLEGLPAGEYFIGPAGIADPSEIDSLLLEALAAVSERLGVSHGEVAELSLQLGEPR